MTNLLTRTFLSLIGLSLISFCTLASGVIDSNGTQKELNPPILNQIWIQGKPIKSDKSVAETTSISLPFGQNFFTVEFISINYNNQHNLKYAHQLLGIDSSWVYSGNQRRASYANLGSGTYPLKIRVSNDGWNWIENTQQIDVVVTPPFWAGWWYQVVVILIIFLALFIIYKIKINAAISQVLEIAEIRKKESESLRLMMAQDFHDEMGNKLASIIVLASTLQLLIKDKSKDVQKSLLRIEKASKELFDGTKSFIWSINPDSDHIGAVITYVNNFAAELFENTHIGFRVEDRIKAGDWKKTLLIGHSRQLFFILKEALTNVLVHSKCKNILLSYSFDKSTDTLCISIEDDGVGVTVEQLKSSRGLNNMKSRAAKINYDLAFYHNPNGGFGVRIEGIFPKN